MGAALDGVTRDDTSIYRRLRGEITERATLSLQALKAAKVNPVRCLRDE